MRYLFAKAIQTIKARGNRHISVSSVLPEVALSQFRMAGTRQPWDVLSARRIDGQVIALRQLVERRLDGAIFYIGEIVDVDEDKGEQAADHVHGGEDQDFSVHFASLLRTPRFNDGQDDLFCPEVALPFRINPSFQA
ncbi:hypothetical protein [Rhizobium sp. Leaf371]|uniref:hypothetical protein n=1 Tax=Rhizobium sp. Leaf371 TaxID=1736355 RepID=UPI0012E91E13|nr:hypothetical protein [Rhizobium sp. Leaf371]